MKATREWGPCSCNCGKVIGVGNEFRMVDGSMFLVGHEERRTRQIPVVKPEKGKAAKGKGKGARDGFSDLPLFRGKAV